MEIRKLKSSVNAWAKRVNSVLSFFGIDPIKAARHVAALPRFLHSYRHFKDLHFAAVPAFEFRGFHPHIEDDVGASGIASGHYFHQDFLIARRIFERSPRRHADIGSRIDGFVAHVAVFREIEVFDIRPLPVEVKNVVFRQLDIARGIDPAMAEAYDSVSCLHALEHFGLGRYGDPLDYYGFEKGFEAISTLLCRGGTLYLSVPMGPQRIEFNAQRVFSLNYLQSFCGCGSKYRVERFSYVDDSGDLHEQAKLGTSEANENFGCNYGLAILEMVKI
jgi:hypothetical protein